MLAKLAKLLSNASWGWAGSGPLLRRHVVVALFLPLIVIAIAGRDRCMMIDHIGRDGPMLEAFISSDPTNRILDLVVFGLAGQHPRTTPVRVRYPSPSSVCPEY